MRDFENNFFPEKSNFLKEISILKQEIENNKNINENLKYNILDSLENLKYEVDSKNKANFEKEKIFLNSKFDSIKEIIKTNSIIEKNQLFTEIAINSLKDEINFNNILEKYLPRNLIKIARNPNLPHEHIIWISLWAANSIISIWESIFKIWLWIVKMPYDLYLLISWKGEIESIKKV